MAESLLIPALMLVPHECHNVLEDIMAKMMLTQQSKGNQYTPTLLLELSSMQALIYY